MVSAFVTTTICHLGKFNKQSQSNTSIHNIEYSTQVTIGPAHDL